MLVRITFMCGALAATGFSATYYVDYVNGNDANSAAQAQSKSTPWKHAPGMQFAAGSAAGTALNPGDSVILKGGITWPGSGTGVWYINSNGAAGSQIYFGVDQTWYDTAGCQQVLGATIASGGSGYSDPVSVTFSGGGGSGATGYALRNSSGGIASVVMINRGSGYTSAPTAIFSGGAGSGATGTATVNSGWCRPIFNYGGTVLNYNGRLEPIFISSSYDTVDNFEFVGVANAPLSGLIPTVINVIGGSGPTTGTNNLISNHYIHGWTDPYYCVGTGNIAAGSSTITNFVPSYGTGGPSCPGLTGWAAAVSPAFLPVQVFPQGSYWPVQGNGPAVQSISGSSPYTIATTSSTVGSACNSCRVVVGYDGLRAFSGNAGTNNGTFVTNNVVDGSDTLVVYQQNPYPDCGASVGNNNMCVASGHLADQGPGYFTNNVARFLGQNYFGSCAVIAGNLVEYLRIPTDPTGHGNGWECFSEGSANSDLVYNNVFRHWSIANASAPAGHYGIGVSISLRPNGSQHDYVFNNIISDTTTNYFWQLAPPTSGGSGIVDLFNNSGDCGLAWDMSGPCANAWTGTTNSTNENYVTTNSAAFQSGVHVSNSITASPTLAATYTSSSPFLYSPLSGSPTIGAGVSIAALCTAVTAIYAPAGTACLSDTTYGASYDSLHHTAITGARTAVLRNLVTPTVGAYQYTTGSPISACDVNGDGVVNSTDVALEINQSLGINACTSDIDKDGVCDVVDVQRVTNASLGGACVSP